MDAFWTSFRDLDQVCEEVFVIEGCDVVVAAGPCFVDSAEDEALTSAKSLSIRRPIECCGLTTEAPNIVGMYRTWRWRCALECEDYTLGSPATLPLAGVVGPVGVMITLFEVHPDFGLQFWGQWVF